MFKATPKHITSVLHALALIRQLEADKQQLEWMLTHMNQLHDAAAGRALKMEERVRQLEAELEDMTARYKIADDCAKKKGEMNEKLYAELAAVKAERDAAIRDMTEIVQEYGETYCDYCGADFKPNCTGRCWTHSEGFKWRGVQKEGWAEDGT